MEKKFIALIVAFVILVTSVAVGAAIFINKKDTYVDSDGVEHWLVKDDEGNTMLNGEGEVLVYATDEKGQRQKDKNGEYIIAAIDFPEIVTDGNTLETPDYKLTMPKGWELQEDGTFTLKKNDNVQVQVDVFEQEEVVSIDSYMENTIKTGEEFIDAVKEGYPKSTFEHDAKILTKKKLDCRTILCKFEKNDGSVEYAIEAIYFIRNNRVYKLSLYYYDSTYNEYNKDIDFVNIIDANFVVKEYMKK